MLFFYYLNRRNFLDFQRQVGENFIFHRISGQCLKIRSSRRMNCYFSTTLNRRNFLDFQRQVGENFIIHRWPLFEKFTYYELLFSYYSDWIVFLRVSKHTANLRHIWNEFFSFSLRFWELLWSKNWSGNQRRNFWIGVFGIYTEIFE